MTPAQARAILDRLDAHRDFHVLPQETVGRLVDLARQNRYREPRDANGSRARYFHAYLVRLAARAPASRSEPDCQAAPRETFYCVSASVDDLNGRAAPEPMFFRSLDGARRGALELARDLLETDPPADIARTLEIASVPHDQMIDDGACLLIRLVEVQP